jgi:hypothetical protein
MRIDDAMAAVGLMRYDEAGLGDAAPDNIPAPPLAHQLRDSSQPALDQKRQPMQVFGLKNTSHILGSGPLPCHPNFCCPSPSRHSLQTMRTRALVPARADGRYSSVYRFQAL